MLNSVSTPEEPLRTLNCIFTKHDSKIDVIESGQVKVDRNNNIVEAFGPDGFPFDFTGYEVTVFSR